MNKNMQRLYKDLSWTWPIISPPEEYDEEGQAIFDKIIEYAAIETNSLLNLGCGGGNMDWFLKREFQITGVDLSENMLTIARKLNPEIEYIKGDMRDIRLDKKFDAVMIHDSINHILTLKDLKKVFDTAYYHLKKDGLVITFVEMWPERFEQNMVQTLHGEEDDIEITFIEHYYDSDPDDSIYECTFIYLIRRSGNLAVEHDHHLFGIFPLDDWDETIGSSGFKVERLNYVHFGGKDKFPMFIGIKR